jgi:hypothetical protein
MPNSIHVGFCSPLSSAGECATPEGSSNPLAGWRISDVRDKAITDDYRSYIQSLPPEERKYIETHATHIEDLEDGTGQHAVRIEMDRYGTGWAHVLMYDQSHTRVKAMRVAHPQISLLHSPGLSGQRRELLVRHPDRRRVPF